MAMINSLSNLNPAYVVLGLFLSLTIVFTRFLFATLRPKNYPPGPPTIPGLGNLHQIPSQQAFIQFNKWGKTYGGIIGLKSGASNLVILNSAQALRELFSKRAAIYSDRPHGYVTSDCVYAQHGDKHIVNLQNTPYHKRLRAAAADLTSATGLKQVVPLQEATAATLVKKLLETDPESTETYLKHWALATPLLAITGERLENRGKVYFDRFFKAQKHWTDLQEPTNAPLAEIVPILRLVPEQWAPWKTTVRYVHKYMIEEYAEYLKSARRIHDNGHTKSPVLMVKVLEADAKDKSGKVSPFTDEQLGYLAGAMLDAAVDTSHATIASFVLYLAANPAVQKKAYEEISRVSPDQPPRGNQIGDLPYVRACLFEILRLVPGAPVGVPHTLNKDDVVDGYRIPKGTTVIPNIFGMSRSTDDYDRPDEFIPERYMDDPLGLKSGADKTDKRATYAFGLGRRICPGEQFAQASMMVAMAKLLWTFEIVPAEKLDLTLETGFHKGLALGPEPYKVDFVLRDEGKKAEVMKDWEDSESALEQLGL